MPDELFDPAALTMALVWTHTGDGEVPYQAQVAGQDWALRVNDFPAEPLYTLFIAGVAVADLEDWPGAWVRPALPPPCVRAALRSAPPP